MGYDKNLDNIKEKVTSLRKLTNIDETQYSDEEDENLGLGTAHMLEMAQAFANIKFAEKWGPRRGVRFCSWGGGKEQRGLIEFLKVMSWYQFSY